jgi:hypothetical protein
LPIMKPGTSASERASEIDERDPVGGAQPDEARGLVRGVDHRDPPLTFGWLATSPALLPPRVS